MASLRVRLLLAVALGLVVFLGLTLYANLGLLLRALGTFRWELLPLLLALALLNYLLRFVKWHYYLGQVGGRGVSLGMSLLIFMSGLAMVVTPWGLGQWLKSYLVTQARGIPFSQSAPVVVAERLTDALGMGILTLAGVFTFRMGWSVVAVLLLLAGLLTGLFRYRPLGQAVIRGLAKLPLVSRQTGALEQFYRSSYTLFSLRNVLAGVALSAVSWFGEALAFYLTLRGLGVETSLLSATFIYALSVLAGSLLFLPGGLGVADGSLAGLLQVLLGVTREIAVAATLIIRLATLWFAVALGVVALLVTLRWLRPRLGSLPEAKVA